MPVKVSWEDEEKSLDVRQGSKVEDVFERIDVNPETVIVEMNGEVVSLEEELCGDEDLRLINVVSGG